MGHTGPDFLSNVFGEVLGHPVRRHDTPGGRSPCHPGKSVCQVGSVRVAGTPPELGAALPPGAGDLDVPQPIRAGRLAPCGDRFTHLVDRSRRMVELRLVSDPHDQLRVEYIGWHDHFGDIHKITPPKWPLAQQHQTVAPKQL